MSRIVSLLPAATDIVRRLGLSDQLVGVSHECVVDAHVPVLTRSNIRADQDGATVDQAVRDTLARGESLFALDEELLLTLTPSLVLSQSLCNVCALDGTQVQRALRRCMPRPVVIEYSPTTLGEVCAGIEAIGLAAGVVQQGRGLARRMRRELFDACRESSVMTARPTVVFLEWLDPLFCCGHWIPQLIELAGGRELIGQAGERSRTIEPKQLIEADPDLLVLCCCGWSVDRTRQELTSLWDEPWWQALRAVQTARVYVVDAVASFTQPSLNLANDCLLLVDLIHRGVPAGGARVEAF